jgi:hypothetical protein
MPKRWASRFARTLSRSPPRSVIGTLAAKVLVRRGLATLTPRAFSLV